MRSMCALLAFATTTAANQYDVVMPRYLPPSECTAGCASWADVLQDGVTNMTQSAVDALFATGSVPATAGSHCIMPGASPVHNEGRRLLLHGEEEDSWLWEAAGRGKPPKRSCDNELSGKCVLSAAAGPYCLCKGGKGAAMAYCDAPMGTPEQINLQYAAPDTVVAAFVTYEKAPPADPPTAMFGPAGSGGSYQLTGVSHWYVEPTVAGPWPGASQSGRNYSMHFVKFSGLKPATSYSYKVKSGAAGAVWSDSFTFRSLRPAPETRIAMYGDMGFSKYNNMANLLEDCQSGTIDVFAHMGDHAYNLGQVDDRKGDAYMNAMQPLLATCPWIPIIGNHEASDGDHTHRYLNQTWGGAAYANPLAGSRSSATTALGHVLTKGTYLGAGIHGTTPSGTSAYFSVDVGLFHIAALSTATPKGAELAWLTADLSAASEPARRAQVPWIIVTSHYPIYNPKMQENAHCSAAAFESIEGELADPAAAFRTCEQNGEGADCRTVGDVVSESAATTESLLLRFGVDIWNAGHAHEYDVTWPIVNGTAPNKHYRDPAGPVYITEGNGGVPGVVGEHKFFNVTPDWGRIHGTGGAYGLLYARNDSRLQYEHVWNNGNNGTGQVMETWAIERSFPHAAPKY